MAEPRHRAKGAILTAALALLPVAATADVVKSIFIQVEVPITPLPPPPSVPRYDVYAFAQESEESDLTFDGLLVGALPFQGQLAAIDGSASSSAIYDLTPSGLDIRFSHALGPMAFVAASEGELLIEVGAPVDFLLDGAFAARNEVGTKVSLEVGLFDLTLEEPVFFVAKRSDATQDVSFLLDDVFGDRYGELVGLPKGTLLPGREYLLEWDYLLAYGGPGGATAEGSLSLTPIPEPSTILLVGGGFIAFALRRSGKQR